MIILSKIVSAVKSMYKMSCSFWRKWSQSIREAFSELPKMGATAQPAPPWINAFIVYGGANFEVGSHLYFAAHYGKLSISIPSERPSWSMILHSVCEE